VREPARTAGSARRNEKTAENPRSWPLISGHPAPQGRCFVGFSLFFQGGEAHCSRKAFWYFWADKSTREKQYFYPMNRKQATDVLNFSFPLSGQLKVKPISA
jgi:hypothetical protein